MRLFILGLCLALGWVGWAFSLVPPVLARPVLSSNERPAVVITTTRFAVIGDYGSGSADEAAVANLVKSWLPEFIITVGDNNYPLGEEATIDAHIGQFYYEFIYPYQGSYGPVESSPEYPYKIYLPVIYSSTTPVSHFFPSLGNHDWYTTAAAPYLAYFTLPGNERYYDFTQGPVHFFALDSDPNEPDGITSSSIQAAWLQNKLAASTACWQLVYFHHAPYSSGLHGSDTNLQWPFQTWGADTVLTGHDHDYERVDVNGLPYFVNGVGGSTLRDFLIPVAGSQLRYKDNYGAMLVTASPTTITYQFVITDGTVIDTYTQTGGCSN